MKNKVFKNFLEYYSMTKSLQDYQKEIIFNSLSKTEQRYLCDAYKLEGWEDLFIRNEIDCLLDELEQDFGINLIMLRIQVANNKKVKKVKKALWGYINELFSRYSMRHIWHLFEGIRPIDQNKDWILLVPSERGEYGKKTRP